MATTGISGSGGIDVAALVSQLMTIERQPLDRLDTKETSYKAKLTALGLIKSQVSGFQTAVKALGSSDSSSLLAFNATSSDTTVFSASAGSTAVAGTYSLNVTSLAQRQSLVAAGATSKTAAISDGTATTVTFDFGTIDNVPPGTLTNGVYSGANFTSNGTVIPPITIDGSNNTLEGIRDAINAANAGVSATIVNDGSATPYRLVLTSSNSGASNSLKITTSGGDGTIDALLGHDPGGLPAAQHLNQTVAAQNAVFTVNGISISKSSNTVTDAIQGVTLTLSKEATPATLTVARDTTAISDKVAAFVKAYNDTYTAVKNASAYKSSSALEGDSTLRGFQTQLRDIASAAVSGGTMTQLFEVGITFNASGVMQLDSAKLNSAMSTNFSDFANLFNSATGYATKFNTWATDTLAINGTIDSKTKGINRSITDIGTRRTSLEAQLKIIERRYTTQFSNLNVMLSQMNSTSTYLTQQLARL
jgi:flagellar hook-associated protein 2